MILLSELTDLDNWKIKGTKVSHTVFWYGVKFSLNQRNNNSGYNPLVSDQMAMMDALKGKQP